MATQTFEASFRINRVLSKPMRGMKMKLSTHDYDIDFYVNYMFFIHVIVHLLSLIWHFFIDLLYM